MSRRILWVGIAAAASAVTALAAGALTDTGSKTVGFEAKGPAGLKIRGTTHSLKAIEKQGVLEIAVPLKGLDTGISLRDKHLRKYLEVGKFPSALLRVPRKNLDLPKKGKEVSGGTTGTLTLHGKSNPLPFRYKLKSHGQRYAVQGLASLDIRDYGIEVPCYLGVCVHPNVKIKVEFSLGDD